MTGADMSSAVEASDTPYCGENNASSSDVEMSARVSPVVRITSTTITTTSATASSRVVTAVASSQSTDAHEMCLSADDDETSPTFATSASANLIEQHRRCYDMPEYLKNNEAHSFSSTGSIVKGANGSTARVPAIYASAVRSDCEAMTPEGESGVELKWQTADYV
jgi:hypothetical protein